MRTRKTSFSATWCYMVRFFMIPKQYFCTTMLFKMLIHDTIVCIIIRFLCQVKNRLIQVRLSLNLLEAIKIWTAYITRKHLRITDESTMFNNYREIIPGDFESLRISCSFKIFVSSSETLLSSVATLPHGDFKFWIIHLIIWQVDPTFCIIYSTPLYLQNLKQLYHL